MAKPLSHQTCQPLPAESPALKAPAIKTQMAALKGWKQEQGQIFKTFKFEDYYETISFINAVAYLANQQDHHPDMEVGYNKLTIRFSTHSVGGLSMNDFICAAKIDLL